MIRIATWLWIAIAGAMGYGLYQLKQEVLALENDLFRLNRQIVQEQQNIHVLKAEWSYINQPGRLQALAQRHLDLQPMSPKQFGRLEALPALPAQLQPGQLQPGGPGIRATASAAPAPVRPTETR